MQPLSDHDREFLVTHLRRFFPKEKYKIYLFGSFAQGKGRSSSDVDLAIRGQGELPPAIWQEAISFFEDSTFSKEVDLVDYHRVSDSFRQIIDRDGVPLD